MANQLPNTAAAKYDEVIVHLTATRPFSLEGFFLQGQSAIPYIVRAPGIICAVCIPAHTALRRDPISKTRCSRRQAKMKSGRVMSL